MSEDHLSRGDLVPLGQAERICREQAGMSPAEFRHELAEHVRGNGGLGWVATTASLGVCRAALDGLVRRRNTGPKDEDTDDRQS